MTCHACSPDYSGALCLGSARCIEFVEMFKAPLKELNPILTATQEGNFKGTEALPALPRRLVRYLLLRLGGWAARRRRVGLVAPEPGRSWWKRALLDG
jgi:hypothetical protein